jgi:tRNA-binding EMAP/Myf-like protein
MSSLIVEICEIKNLKKHPNADKLALAECKGWQVIVGLNQYQENDRVVFIPPDCVIPDNLIEKYELAYLKHNGRTGTVKLRGEMSNGLVLEVPAGKWKLGDNVADAMEITKWEPPQSVYSGGVKQTSKKKLNPDFDRYTEIENIKNFNSVFKDGDEVIITEKIHGCLEKKTKILLTDGSSKTIGEIVDKKIEAFCLGKDSNGNLVPSKITNWFDNGKTKEWLNIQYARRGFETQGNSFGSLKCTPDHKIYSLTCNGYIEAKYLKKSDKILISKKILDLSFIQKSILTGIMLGDGSYGLNNEKSASVSFSHKKSHEKYIDYTLKCLGSIAGNKQSEYTSGYGTRMCKARTVSSHLIYKEFNKWFNENNNKIVPNNIELNPISLAFWYMDDGSISHTELQKDRALFAVCGFDEASIDNLVKAFDIQLGIKAEKYISDSYWRIRLNAKEADKLFKLIAPYICAPMAYKLPNSFRQNTLWYPRPAEEEAKYYNITEEKEIISVKPIKNLKNVNTTKYDIETETHNYFANEILVHNCNARYGLLEISLGGNVPLISKISAWWKKNILKQKYEFVYGSHNVQITGHTSRMSFYGDDVWGTIGKRYDIKSKLLPGMIIYGEIYGEGIQDLTYGIKGTDFAVFDIKEDEKYLDWERVEEYCEMLDLKTVPVLYQGDFSEIILDKCTGGDESVLFPTQVREGCVVKPLHEENNPQIGRKVLKSINPEYLLRKNGTEFK